MLDLAHCRDLDAKDPLRGIRERFARGEGDTIYLDGNSIGAMPADAPARVQKVMSDGWRDARRRGWNRFDWLEKPWLMGEGIAHILGAGKHDVVFCDNTSVNLYKILSYAWQLDRRRPVIVTETWNFPTDMYVAEGLVRFAGGDAAVRRIDSPDALEAALTKEGGVLYLSHVDYRSSRRWDMAAVNRKAAALGILTLWDCSHSAAAVAADLAGRGAAFAVACARKCEERGGAVIFSHPGAGSVTEALLDNGVVSSFRKPDSIRFGVSPVALSHEDLWTAVARLKGVLSSGVWREPKFAKVSV